MVIERNNWEQNLAKINSVENVDKKIKMMIECFLSTFSIEETMLFRYSPIDHLAEGIVCANTNEFKCISSIRDDVTTIPAIFEAIQKKSAQYFESNDFHLNIPRKYIIAENQNSLLVVPIIFNHVVVGYFLGTHFHKNFDPQLLMEANLFSSQVGEMLFNHPCYVENNEIKLSKREFEVMKCVAFGYSSKQIAHLLEISETTIKQYIKSVMSKTNTSNRTHAVAFLFQKRILT
ncbi:transcriptional regulator NarP [Solibacillus isronensis B3W22]|uniref:Transcriptional regulator NarP n=1 Tax=Solibacillus isronensis B3W22 TaxID=1224748 RepID=K1KQL1_9BACL|nr:helix-turn-helix transcriptional regulator [Solibacillus silvestris]EKB46450.1 transcriptional regulator NarP [Solibacillus isronensis B3W22]